MGLDPPSMDSDQIAFQSISDISRLIQKKEISPVELVDLILARIDHLNPHLNAFITVLDRSREYARVLEKELVNGQVRGPLHGVPISLKDLILTQGIRTTCGSKIMRENNSDEDAPVVQKLHQAGAVLVGKTNLHEFAFGVTSNNPHFGPVRNPWDRSRVAGGSSGGSAAAVASGMGFASIGSDTRGSIRIPAAACGIVGLKPTYGLVSTRGVIPLSWSLDHIGPLARSVEDAALVLEAIAGHDAQDPASVTQSTTHYAAALERDPAQFAIGICREYFFEKIDPEIRKAVEEAVDVLRSAGMEVREVEIPHIGQALEASTHIQRPEATAYHQDYLRSHAADYGVEVRQKLEMGWTVSAVEYMNAQWTRQLLKEEFNQVFQQVHCLAAPTLPAFPPPLGEDFVTISGEQEDVGQAYVRLNAPQNLTGLPALSLPCGFGSQGLPIGLQLIAPAFQESTLLTIGAAYQRLTDWHLRRPPLPFFIVGH